MWHQKRCVGLNPFWMQPAKSGTVWNSERRMDGTDVTDVHRIATHTVHIDHIAPIRLLQNTKFQEVNGTLHPLSLSLRFIQGAICKKKRFLDNDLKLKSYFVLVQRQTFVV